MDNYHQEPVIRDPTTVGNWTQRFSGNVLDGKPIPQNQHIPGEDSDLEEDNLVDDPFANEDPEMEDDNLEDDPYSIDQEESYPGLSEDDLDEEDQI